MVYNPAIPAAADDPSVSQGQLLENFSQNNLIIGVDHVNFDNSLPVGAAAADRGQHSKVTLYDVIADPGEADPKVSLYTKTVGVDSELFFEKFDNGAGANLIQQMTNLVVTTAGGNNGITTPWGIVLNWGTYNVAANFVDIVFAVPFVGVPVVTLGREDNVTPTTKYVSYNLGSVINTGFRATSSTPTLAGSYIAIGV